MSKEINRALETLQERESTIVRMYFGLGVLVHKECGCLNTNSLTKKLTLPYISLVDEDAQWDNIYKAKTESAILIKPETGKKREQ